MGHLGGGGGYHFRQIEHEMPKFGKDKHYIYLRSAFKQIIGALLYFNYMNS